MGQMGADVVVQEAGLQKLRWCHPSLSAGLAPLTMTTPPDCSAVHMLMMGAMPMVVPWKYTPLQERRHRVTSQSQDISLSFPVLCFCQAPTKTPLLLLTFAGRKQWKAQMGCADAAELNPSVPAPGTSIGSPPLDHPHWTTPLDHPHCITSFVFTFYCCNRTLLPFLCFCWLKLGTGIKIMSLTQRRVIVMQGEVYVLLVMMHSLECNNFKQGVIIHIEQSNISGGTVWKGSIYSYSGNGRSK